MTPAGEINELTGAVLGRAFDLPRLVIAAPQGRSGKTTVSLGLCAALAGRGLAVQPYKKGPDYIDPSWLSAAAGRACRSLDAFFLPEPDSLRLAFAHGMIRLPKPGDFALLDDDEDPSWNQADFALIEGNHGLYDSTEPDGEGSTADVARTLGAPVLLVVNAARMSRSAAAMVHGYQTFEPDTPIAGVILNNVAHGRHEERLRQSIESHCGLPVVGALPRDDSLTIPDRHLGLVPQREAGRQLDAITACRRAVEKHVDLDKVLEIARKNIGDAKWELRNAHSASHISHLASPISPPASPIRIGVIRDEAFTFYYPENLEALEDAGAKLVFVDALHDEHLPAVDVLYIGGGFPEVFMDLLTENRGFREDVRCAVQAGLPVYAECGGLMYLGQGIRYGERYAEMTGALPYWVEMTDTPQGHGYVLAEVDAPTPFFQLGERLRGHEFHHSRLVLDGRHPATALRLFRGCGVGNRRDGLVFDSIHAGYTHLHAYGSPGWAPGMIAAARRGSFQAEAGS